MYGSFIYILGTSRFYYSLALSTGPFFQRSFTDYSGHIVYTLRHISMVLSGRPVPDVVTLFLLQIGYMKDQNTILHNRVPNRLIKEKSPYLLQHAFNPVNWFPWGEEAFEQAHILNRPIFLSIGYSTCHWCHVMERESFEDVEIAEFMNSHFVNIKVDREERPDLDSIYMQAVQIMTGQGGWPLSVFLTPSLKPFFGGTYFSPEDRPGFPGFRTVLRIITQNWKNKNEKVFKSADEILAAIRDTASFKFENSPVPNFDLTAKQTFQDLAANFDPKNGGFGGAPKFPMPTYLNFLLHYQKQFNEPVALEMVEFTLKNMIKGGIYDQVGGGFARYSTDTKWLIPHFEKMLYDNAQLLDICASLYQITHNPLYEAIIRETANYVRTTLTHIEGGFYTGEDADSDGKEGAFYVWTFDEIKSILKGPEGEVFIRRFGVTPLGNFFDPESGDRGNNVLFRAKSIENLAAEFKLPPEKIEGLIALAKKKIFKARAARPRPSLDDKILTGWNGLIISALSKAAGALREPTYLDLAVKAATFIRQNLFDPAAQKLYRRWKGGERKILAHQSDFAFLAAGLIDLFQVSGQTEWLEWAASLHELHNELFLDNKHGGYFMTLHHPDLLIRMQEDSDGVIPSGNSAAALNGLKLSRLMDREDFLMAAEKTIGRFSNLLSHYPTALTTMLLAMDFLYKGETQIVIWGELDREETRSMTESVFDRFLGSHLIVPVSPGDSQKKLARIVPFIENMRGPEGKATVFVCKNFTCEKPVQEPSEVTRLLSPKRKN